MISVRLTFYLCDYRGGSSLSMRKPSAGAWIGNCAAVALAINLHSFPLQFGLRRTIMQFGATMWFTEYSISPSELAVAIEERGFESLWASEHSHLPVPENSGNGGLRREQADVMDPFLTLTA